MVSRINLNIFQWFFIISMISSNIFFNDFFHDLRSCCFQSIFVVSPNSEIFLWVFVISQEFWNTWCLQKLSRAYKIQTHIWYFITLMIWKWLCFRGFCGFCSFGFSCFSFSCFCSGLISCFFGFGSFGSLGSGRISFSFLSSGISSIYLVG